MCPRGLTRRYSSHSRCGYAAWKRSAAWAEDSNRHSLQIAVRSAISTARAAKSFMTNTCCRGAPRTRSLRRSSSTVQPSHPPDQRGQVHAATGPFGLASDADPALQPRGASAASQLWGRPFRTRCGGRLTRGLEQAWPERAPTGRLIAGRREGDRLDFP